MPTAPLDHPCPPHLEDEAFLIETSGEMPEVALEESLAQLGPLPEEEIACLRAAAARAYLRLIKRDLDHRAVGLAHFRGLERAGQNLGRLGRYLQKLGWELPAAVRRELSESLGVYLKAEEEALERGRPYASAKAQDARALAVDLGIDPAPLEPLLALMARRPAPDFRGLACLRRLTVAGACYKRRRERDGACLLEVLGADAATALGRANLPLTGADEQEDPESRRRLEMVWSLLNLPACQS